MWVITITRLYTISSATIVVFALIIKFSQTLLYASKGLFQHTKENIKEKYAIDYNLILEAMYEQFHLDQNSMNIPNNLYSTASQGIPNNPIIGKVIVTIPGENGQADKEETITNQQWLFDKEFVENWKAHHQNDASILFSAGLGEKYTQYQKQYVFEEAPQILLEIKKFLVETYDSLEKNFKQNEPVTPRLALVPN